MITVQPERRKPILIIEIVAIQLERDLSHHESVIFAQLCLTNPSHKKTVGFSIPKIKFLPKDCSVSEICQLTRITESPSHDLQPSLLDTLIANATNHHRLSTSTGL